MSYLVSVSSHGNTEGSGKSKICQFQVVILINEKILRFEVAMQDTMRVAVKESRSELMGKFLK